MRTWYDAPAYFVLGAVHAFVYWISVSGLSPLSLVLIPRAGRFGWVWHVKTPSVTAVAQRAAAAG